MDASIAAAARALAAGDPLGALNEVALREDPPALALRGIAMAQLGDLVRARELLRRAARGFGATGALASARCVVAEAEIALVSRDLAWFGQTLAAARATLEQHGELENAEHARNIEARRLLLIGRLDEACRLLEPAGPARSPAVTAARELIVAGIALRRLRTHAARAAFARAVQAARKADIPALTSEVERAALVLQEPAGCLIVGGRRRPASFDEVEAILASGTLVVDACRHVVRGAQATASLARRPVLFLLARALAESWPADVGRDALIARVFRTRHADESHRARLRVEMGRLRAELRHLAEIKATPRGFVLKPRHVAGLVVLAPPVETRHAALLALLADGQAWSSSALAVALGTSPRTVQRALEELRRAGAAQSFGLGRARRWIASSVPGFPTVLLLPGPLPAGLG